LRFLQDEQLLIRATIMWWKLVLLTIYLAVLFVLSRILEAVSYYHGGYLASRLLDPVSLSVRKLKAILDQRGVSYTGVVERYEFTDLIQTSGILSHSKICFTYISYSFVEPGLFNLQFCVLQKHVYRVFQCVLNNITKDVLKI